MLQVAGIVRLAGRKGGKFGRHRLAHDHGPGAAKRRDASGVGSRLASLMGAAAVFGW
jgi:hypothetical protein